MRRRRSTRPNIQTSVKKKESMFQVAPQEDQSEKVQEEYKSDYNTIDLEKTEQSRNNSNVKEAHIQYYNMHSERKTNATSGLDSSPLLRKKKSQPTLEIADPLADINKNLNNPNQTFVQQSYYQISKKIHHECRYTSTISNI